jgi:hypothetical protein
MTFLISLILHLASPQGQEPQVEIVQGNAAVFVSDGSAFVWIEE